MNEAVLNVFEENLRKVSLIIQVMSKLINSIIVNPYSNGKIPIEIREVLQNNRVSYVSCT